MSSGRNDNDPPAATERFGYERHAPRLVLHSWLAPFVVVAVVAQLAAVVLPGTDSMAAYLASCVVLVVAVALALVLPAFGVASWVRLLAPCAYLIALALLFKSQGSVSTGLQALVLLPIGWVALYHSGRESAVVVLVTVCMLAVTSSLAGVSTVVMVRGAALWGLTGALIVLGTHRLRRWLSDALNEREEALRQAELLGDVARELNSVLDPEWVVATGVRLAAEIVSPPGARAHGARTTAGSSTGSFVSMPSTTTKAATSVRHGCSRSIRSSQRRYGTVLRPPVPSIPPGSDQPSATSRAGKVLRTARGFR